MSGAVSDETTFAQLGLDPRIIAAVTKLGFSAPTPIQAKAIGPLLLGRDLVGRARTGSGKTAAFGLPLIDRLARGGGGGVRALVLAPTRELALQITAALRTYSSELRLKMITLYGGAAYQPQLDALRRGVDVVVGTPGRLLDHLRRDSLDLSDVQLVVVDEADEMLRMGFIEDLTQILQATPETRQVALFSATMPDPIRRVAETYLHAPLEVHVEQRRLVVEHIEQYRIDVPHGHKTDTLARVLKSKDAGATLIFARTRVTCDELAEALRSRGFAAQALHGAMSQPAREQVLGELRAHRLELVVATDVAARGIDVEHLACVINFDLPEEVEIYVNRIGRTARAGRKGLAVSLVTRRDLRLLRHIEQRLKSKIDPRRVPSDAQIVERQRADLEASLQAALQHENKDNAAALLSLLQQGEGEWTSESLATAALGLLMQDRHLEIESTPSAEPPPWARRPERRPRSNTRLPGGPTFSRDRASAEQVTVSAAVGRAQGIGPNDVVGALAGEFGVPRQVIGRIKIQARQLTVTLSAEVAAFLASSPRVVYLRGNPVTFTPTDRDSIRERPKRKQGGPRSNKPRAGAAPSPDRHPAAGYLSRTGAKAKRGKGKLGKKPYQGRQGPVRKGK
jgi:ATP-dependent RNA helicase DeaD